MSKRTIPKTLQNVLVYDLKYFIDIQTSKELIQMGINKMMTNGIFTMNGEHIYNQKTNITDFRIRQSGKPF